MTKVFTEENILIGTYGSIEYITTMAENMETGQLAWYWSISLKIRYGDDNHSAGKERGWRKRHTERECAG